MKKYIEMLSIPFVALALLLTASFTLTGCDNKEKVLDVETPGGEIEIERDKDSGAVGVEVDKK
ncbi:hypothetical protein [Gimesia fumaroli]|jgi:predicted small secreted protein|uniref:Lipoprotein n=1 Tax=Gimesia fumaroli TaxID=2527976 RepID=A0A518I9J0_9PLAN|nr:hypothetical protein [Gimesia fumaroli]QDV49776.1 hypothetical protein Enr17x_17970 [Gimesia fumaroli]